MMSLHRRTCQERSAQYDASQSPLSHSYTSSRSSDQTPSLLMAATHRPTVSHDARSSLRLMANLRRSGALLVNLAVASLAQKTGVGIRVAPDGPGREHIRFHQHLRVFDRDVV